MKKILSFLFLTTLLLLGGKAWGADDVKITINISSFSGLPTGTAAYDTYSWSSGGVSGKATIYANKNSTSMQFNASNYLFYSTSAIPGVIKSIKMTTASGTNRTYVVYGGTSAYSGSGTSYGTQIGSQTVTTSGTTFTVSSGSYTYFTIVKSGSGAGYLSSIEVTYTPSGGGDSNTPSISANDVNIAYNATEDSIGYTLDNATGNVTASVTEGDWLSLGTVTSSAVPFTCSANTAATARTAKVTLSFTGATSKVVTITQAAAPLANIAALTENTKDSTYNVTLTNAVVTYVSGNYAYIQDASGAVAMYKSGHGLTAGDVLNGTATVAYQLRNKNPQITNLSGITPVSGDAPAPTTIAQSAWSYTFSNVLNQYFKITGATITTSNDKYYVSLGGESIQLYKAGGSISSLDLTKTYNIVGFPTLYNSTKEIQIFADPEVVVVTTPALASDPASAQAFTYVFGNGPSDDQMFTITGSNLTSSDITATVSSDYEITDNTAYSGSVTIASGDVVSVRLKAGLAKGAHNGTLTLSSTGATDVVINLSGSVTGQTYEIEQYSSPATAHGTISFLPVSPIEDGTEVTLSAEAAEGYDFTANSWVIYKEDGNDFVVDNSITVTANKFTMPAYAIWVDGTFTAKPKYAVTCVANPVAGGTILADENAYEGQTVTISCDANTGYTLSSIVITKTSDGSATDITPAKSGNDYTFTMPGYAVTATATFLSKTFDGTFALYSGDLTEGDYVLVYNGGAMNDTVSSKSKFGVTAVSVSNNTISNPLRSIVWHIAPSKTSGYWTIYSAQQGSYANGTASSTNISLGNDTSLNTAKWSVSGSYDFRCKANEGEGTERYLRYYSSNDVFGNYAASNGGALTLYKYTVLTPRTITFNGNGGTFNEATTYTQEVYDGIEATLVANKFTKENSSFAGWNNQANGEGDKSYNNESKITVSGGDLTLYAQWATSYTLSIDNSIEGGSVSIEGSVTSAAAGTEITLNYEPAAGHAFAAWNVYKAGDESTKVTVTDNKFTMPEYNVVVSATFNEVQTYSLITNVNQIESGKHYIIASGTNGDVKAIGEQNSNNRAAVAVKASNNQIPETTGVYEFVIYGPNASGYYIIYDENETKPGYLYAASSGSNYLRTLNETTNTANGTWSIAIGNDSVASIIAKGSNTRNVMQNNGNIFACYSTASQTDVYLFKKDNETVNTTSITIGETGYATYYNSQDAYVMPAGVEGYAFSTELSPCLSKEYEAYEVVPAGTGLVLNATAGDYTLQFMKGGVAPAKNQLYGSDAAAMTNTVVDGNYKYYGLSLNASEELESVGFYYMVAEGAAFENGAHKAFLAVDQAATAPQAFYLFNEENNATAIDNLEAGENIRKFVENGRLYIIRNGVVYDAMGRAVK